MSYRVILNQISYHGFGALDNLGKEVKSRDLHKAFVVSDPQLLSLGITGKVTAILDELGIPYEIFSNIKPNPTVDNVKAGVDAFHKSGSDFIVAVGGGSSIDAAKAIGIVVRNNEFGDVLSLEGTASTKYRTVFTIAIPTTAGTAAEATINYVLTDEGEKRKFVCIDPNDIPDIAIVDPSLMSSMGKQLTAATGMDALTHAIEGYITRGANTLSDMFHIKAMELIGRFLRPAVDNLPQGREGMALAQYIAGMGFSNVGLGIVHSMAHALGALYDTAHGLANAIILPEVMEFNAPCTGDKYKHIAQALGEDTAHMTKEAYRRAAVEAVRNLNRSVGIKSSLRGIVRFEDVDRLANSAYGDACRPANPRDVSVEDIKALFFRLM